MEVQISSIAVDVRKEIRLDPLLPRLVTADGKETTLLSVPKYDFDWQRAYVLSRPLTIPAGARIRCIAAFDNSKNNAANPDPSSSIRWGDQTWEEMMIGFYDIATPIEGDAGLDPLARDAKPAGASPKDAQKGPTF